MKLKEKLKNFLKEEKAQLSAEMIILIAAIVAIILLVVTQLQKTTKKANEAVDKTTDDVFKKIEEIN
ncbi:MAG: hypothetical protein PHR26_00805 [Candidatus ainarchaeum sp.]|nr:hypothetical protein [Candidatus ainarchaeum sp.]MDD3976226.1 hypothetical protein [Candidatus ainarchaeum sp.]